MSDNRPGRPKQFTDAENAQRNRDRNRIASQEKTRSNQDIGELPTVKDQIRKDRCSKSLELFCTTYLPNTFYLPLSDMHRYVISKCEQVTWNGGMHAMALPRGTGKTATCRAASLWAILYGYVRYVYFIGANAKSAKKSLEAIKAFVWSDLLLEDFPEAIYPLRKLRREPRACAGQTYKGDPTLTQWSKEAVVFPTIPGSKASGAVFNVDGITSGFRGADFTHPGGTMLRPQLLIIDDPQTDRSSKSDSMCEDRESLISGAALGLAGPDKRISAIMPITVIRPGDLADRMLDHKLHPEWQGSRFGLVKSFPTDVEKWAIYKEKLLSFNPDTPGDEQIAANAAAGYYIDNHAAMNDGAALTWPERFTPDCVDALQYAMNLRIRDESAFWAEYQNKPKETKNAELGIMLKPAEISAKINNLERGHVPASASRLTAFIDVQPNILYYAVCAWEDNFTGYVAEYGTFPEQRLPYFKSSEAQPDLAKATGIAGEDGQLFAGLTALTTYLLGTEWQHGLSSRIKVERCIIDAGYKTSLVFQFCRQAGPYAALLTPSHGKAVDEGGLPMSQWTLKQGERPGIDWIYRLPAESRELRYLMFDPNSWKTFTHERFKVPMGAAGCISVYGTDAKMHRMFADHLTAETPDRRTSEKTGRTVVRWTNPQKKENHWLDCVVGCAVGASFQGVRLAGVHAAPRPRTKAMTLSEMKQIASRR